MEAEEIAAAGAKVKIFQDITNFGISSAAVEHLEFPADLQDVKEGFVAHSISDEEALWRCFEWLDSER